MSEKEPRTLLEHLKHFENHCISYDNLRGAEILAGAQKRIKQLEEIVRIYRFYIHPNRQKEIDQKIKALEG